MLSEQCKQEIHELITKAEAASGAQIICVVAREASEDCEASYGAAAVTAFAIGIVLCFVPQISKAELLQIVALSFIAIKALLAKCPTLLTLITLKSRRLRLSGEFAMQKFYERYGSVKEAIMFCVCVRERCAHIICGAQAAEFISKVEFERITTEFNPSAQGLEPAVLKAMDALCKLAMQVPKNSENNEIEETLVELR